MQPSDPFGLQLKKALAGRQTHVVAPFWQRATEARPLSAGEKQDAQRAATDHLQAPCAPLGPLGLANLGLAPHAAARDRLDRHPRRDVGFLLFSRAGLENLVQTRGVEALEAADQFGSGARVERVGPFEHVSLAVHGIQLFQRLHDSFGLSDTKAGGSSREGGKTEWEFEMGSNSRRCRVACTRIDSSRRLQRDDFDHEEVGWKSRQSRRLEGPEDDDVEIENAQ